MRFLADYNLPKLTAVLAWATYDFQSNKFAQKTTECITASSPMAWSCLLWSVSLPARKISARTSYSQLGAETMRGGWRRERSFTLTLATRKKRIRVAGRKCLSGHVSEGCCCRFLFVTQVTRSLRGFFESLSYRLRPEPCANARRR